MRESPRGTNCPSGVASWGAFLFQTPSQGRGARGAGLETASGFLERPWQSSMEHNLELPSDFVLQGQEDKI